MFVLAKSLSEMSNEELWKLFPIVLKEHNPSYVYWYIEEKENILKLLEGIEIARINHIGSGAVPGLISKPTVDILLEIRNSGDFTELKKRLADSGWLLMSSEYKPDLRLVFNKGYTLEGFAGKVFHLHVRRYADWDELYFRDYLLLHKDAVDEYGALKQKLLKRYEHDRDGYTEAKTEFIRKYTQLARAEFGNKYSQDL